MILIEKLKILYPQQDFSVSFVHKVGRGIHCILTMTPGGLEGVFPNVGELQNFVQQLWDHRFQLTKCNQCGCGIAQDAVLRLCDICLAKSFQDSTKVVDKPLFVRDITGNPGD